MRTEPQPGDVILFARVRDGKFASRLIQRATGSWYTHSIVALGDDRYAHAIPRKIGSVEIIEGDKALAELIETGTSADLFRPKEPPDLGNLNKSVQDFFDRSRVPSVRTEWPCKRINKYPSVFFSDGNLLALFIAREFQKEKSLLKTVDGKRLRNAAIVAAEDGESRQIFCSSFVHRVLAQAGCYLAPPPPGESYVDLTGFATDVPVYEPLGPSWPIEWLTNRIRNALEFVDVDVQTFTTIDDVLRSIKCHYKNETPVPEVLHWANFLTPSDLAESSSLECVASRRRQRSGKLPGWR